MFNLFNTLQLIIFGMRLSVLTKIYLITAISLLLVNSNNLFSQTFYAPEKLALANRLINENPLKSLALSQEVVKEYQNHDSTNTVILGLLFGSRATSQLGDTSAAANFLKLAQQKISEKNASHFVLELSKARISQFIKDINSKKIVPLIEQNINELKRFGSNAEQIEFILFCIDSYKQLLPFDDALKLALRAKQMAEKIKNYKLTAQCNRVIGSVYFKQSLFNQAINSYSLAKNQFEKISDTANFLICSRNISIIHRDIGSINEAFNTLQQNLTIAQASNNIEEIAFTYNLLGSLYLRQGKLYEALDCYNQCIRLRENSDLLRSLGTAFENIARVQKELNQFDEALTSLNRAITIRKELNDGFAISSAYNEMGNIYSQQGKLADALRLYLTSLKSSQENFNLQDAARAFTNIGLTYRRLGSHQNAIKYLTQADELVSDKNDPLNKAYIQINIGNTQRDLNKPDEALKSFGKALELRKRTGNKLLISQSHRNIAQAYYDLGNFYEAYKNLNHALNLSSEIDDKLTSAEIYNELGNVAIKDNELSDAIKYLSKALELFKNNHELDRYGLCIRKIGEIQTKQGNLNDAGKNLNAALNIATEKNNAKLKELTFLALHDLNVAKGDTQNALAFYKKYISARDSLNAINKEESFWHASLNLELYEKTQEIKQIENEVETLRVEAKLRAAQLQQQKTIRNFLVVISLFILLLAIASIWVLWVIRKKNRVLKITNEKLALSERELRKSMQTKDKLFNIIAHDLKSPFTALIGLTELLYTQSSKLTTEQIEKYSHLIHDASEKLLNLIENLLNWSISQTGKIKLSPQSHNLLSIANDVVTVLELQAKSKDINIVNTIPSNIIVVADYNTVSTVIRNITSNAIKFSNKGGTVTIDASINKKYVKISITDDGIGISNDNLSKLFKIEDSFSTKGTGQEVGTGLGLIVCKEFVEKNGGSITVESTPGKGSKFTFTLLKDKNINQ